jgi:hypothetical protein
MALREGGGGSLLVVGGYRRRRLQRFCRKSVEIVNIFGRVNVLVAVPI